MDFDFENYYSNYPTKELLKIMEKQQDYRPEAIAVIQNILAGRTDIDAEGTAFKNETLDDFFEKHRKQEQLEKRFAVFYDLQALIRKPSLIKQDNYLLLFLRTVLFFYYICMLPQLIEVARFILLDKDHFSLFFSALLLIQFLSTPLVIYLLSQKNKNGWIFSAIGKCIEFCYYLYSCWNIFVKYGDYATLGDKIKILLCLLLITGILVILFYKQTQQVLNITKENRQLVFIVAGLGVTAYFFISRFLFG